MNRRSHDLSKRIESFRDEVVSFVENISAADWTKVCDWEEWPVGVTARHLGAGHFAISGMLATIVKGRDLPQLTMDQINAMSKKDAREHMDCTKSEVLELLKENGARLAAFVAGLTDEQLDRQGSMPAFGGTVTTEQFIDYVLFQSARQHLNSMKDTAGS